MRPLSHPVYGMRAEPPLRRPAPTPKDPAPSRIAYRLNRLWLTPLVRLVVRRLMPVSLLALALVVFVATPENIRAVAEKAAETRRAIEQRPEFLVHGMRIESASAELVEDIRELTALSFPVSSFDLALDHMRAEIEGLDAVARADLVIRPGGVLEVRIVERVPAVIWRSREAVELLDAEGRRVAGVAQRGTFPDLPLIVGDGADRAVPEAGALIAAAAPLGERMVGLVRVGERRWDLVLMSGQRILLPERGAVAALEHLFALDAARDLLARDFTVIDLRNPNRPTLRLGPDARAESQRRRGITPGDVL